MALCCKFAKYDSNLELVNDNVYTKFVLNKYSSFSMY